MLARTLFVMTLIFAGFLAGAVRAESFLVVKTVDRADAEQVEVMTPEQLRALQADILEETKLSSKAMALARDEWAKDAANTKSFPNGAIHRRSATPVGPPFDDQAKAEEKRARMTERAAANLADAQDKFEKNMRARYDTEHRREKIAEMAARETERNNFEDKARKIYDAQLTQLKTPAPGTGGAPAAPKAP